MIKMFSISMVKFLGHPALTMIDLNADALMEAGSKGKINALIGWLPRRGKTDNIAH